MAQSISNESKITITITNESKDITITWDEAIVSWEDFVGTWAAHGLQIKRENKNSITITNESKL